MKMLTSAQRTATRTILREATPLAVPIAIWFHISTICNFSCNYCLQSQSKVSNSAYPKRNTLMKLGDYRKIVDNMRGMQIKWFIFSGSMGEPSLNKDLPQMIKYAKDSGVASNVELLSNGTQLTPELTEKLVGAGLDVLRVSLQGVDEWQYKEVGGGYLISSIS